MDGSDLEPQDVFPTTQWNLVRLAVAKGEPGAGDALDAFFRTYDRPVFAFIRSSGTGQRRDAEDLKQAFFAQLLTKESLAEAVRSGLKLRVFLVTKLQSFLIDHYRRSVAQKRERRASRNLRGSSVRASRLGRAGGFGDPLPRLPKAMGGNPGGECVGDASQTV